MQQIVIDSLANLQQAAAAFLQATHNAKVYAFIAPMGTGKTTFITALCKQLGIVEVVNSPTFAIANSYSIPGTQEALYHIDCYRLKDENEALAIGITDYLYSGCRCFIEWPEVIENLLPQDTLVVTIEEQPNGTRIVKF